MSEKKEYIERGAFYQIITSSLVEVFDTGEICELIDAQPAADVEPVVRCENCEHSAINEYADDIDESPYYCFHLDCGVETNGYCSSGKKRAHMERSGSGE